MLRRIAGAVLTAMCCYGPSSFANDEAPRNELANRDLAALQGRWETTLRTRAGAIQNVQTIAGNQSTVDRFNEDGVLVESHTAQFRLRITPDVRVLTYFDLEVTNGPRQGQKFKGPKSFVYVLKNEAWVEARGILTDQQDGPPRMVVWRKIADENVAGTGSQSP